MFVAFTSAPRNPQMTPTSHHRSARPGPGCGCWWCGWLGGHGQGTRTRGDPMRLRLTIWLEAPAGASFVYRGNSQQYIIQVPSTCASVCIEHGPCVVVPLHTTLRHLHANKRILQVRLVHQRLDIFFAGILNAQ